MRICKALFVERLRTTLTNKTISSICGGYDEDADADDDGDGNFIELRLLECNFKFLKYIL